MKILQNLDLNKNELWNAVIQKLATAPVSPVKGQVYFDTVANQMMVFNGTEWASADATSVHTHINKAILDAITAAFTTELQTKLNGIESGAQVNVGTNISEGTRTTTTVPVLSSTGTGATLSQASTSLAGVMSSADKTKLDGIASGAQVNVATNLGYTTAASTGTVTSSTGTNATLPGATTSLAGLMTGADKTKLDGIASGAEVNVQSDWNAASGDALILNKPTLGTAASKNTGTIEGTVPLLGVNGKLDTSVLPALAITDTFVVATQTAMLALTAEVGDVAVRTDLNKSFILKTAGATVLANWQELLTPSDVVSSVSGKTGAVTLVKGDVGLGNVDNTSDANKPVSTAQQTAFNLKANLASPTFTGTVTAPIFASTQATGTSPFTVASTTVVTNLNADKLDGLDASSFAAAVHTHGTFDNAAALSGANVYSNVQITDGIVTGLVSRALTATDIGAAPASHTHSYASKYTASIGNGTDTSFVITHNLNSRDLVVTLREVAAPYAVVLTDIEFTTVNTLTVKFASAPTSSQYQISVVG